MKIRSLSLTAIAGVAVAAGTVTAQTHSESGDAGSLPGSAQVVSGTGVLTNITGSIGGLGDADLFRIVIHDPATFGATTAIAPGTMSDTTLYLFHLDGTGIAKNDDISGSNYLSSLSAGDPKFTSLAPGEYLLGISGYAYSPYWNDPPTVYGDLVFDVLTYTGVLGPQPGAGPVVGWVDVGAYSTGTYNITLTGASFVPAPGSVALLGLGGLVAARRRRVA